MILNLFSKILLFLKSNFKIFFSWLVLVTITLVFQSKIASFLAENSIIKHDDVKKQNFNLAFIILLLIFLIRFFWFTVKNYRISQKHNYFIFFFSSIYLFLRNDENDSLYFSYLSRKHELYYSDIILLIAILSILLFGRNLFFKNWKLYDNIIIWFDKLIKKDEQGNSSFLIEDTPLNNIDINDNEKVIDEVVKAVINLKPSHSFIIGINSIWGIGKTSFLKRLEYKLKSEKIDDECKPITFWFNAWQHQDEKSIINNFFNQLKKELSVFSGNSKNSIDNYLKEMFALVDNKYLNFFKSITDSIFSDGDTIKESYDEINFLIEEIDRKIIVFVDDIDRLNKVEILETLRILRNIADFKNVVFICGFDREYVVKQSQIDNHYLDKIFNLEINLTTQNQKSFVTYLNELINESSAYDENDKLILIASVNKIFYSEESHGIFELEDFLGKNNKILGEEDLIKIELIPSFFFESRRDVKKFFNEFYINIKILKNISDIDLEDYIQLRLLLFKYKWMHKNFASKRISSWLGNKDKLKFEQLNLNKLYIYPDVENQDKIIIYSVLKNLFPDTDVSFSPKSISVKRYFPIYFSNNVFNESFSFTQLYKAIEENNVEELIFENVKGKENEISTKNDIKNLVTNYENIKNVNEYSQVISLIKNGTLGHFDEVEILNIIYLGEKKFSLKLKELLPTIFTNFTDDFGLFLHELNFYRFKLPKEVSLNDDNGSNYKKIDEFEILNNEQTLMILFNVLNLEIDKHKGNPIGILTFSKSFYEKYYTIFRFGVLSVDFKAVIMKFLDDNFESLFLKNAPEQTFEKIELILIANIFEDQDERNYIISESNRLLIVNDSWANNDLDRKNYVIKALDNFVNYVKNKRETINIQFNSEYNDLLDYLYVYKSKEYLHLPTITQIEDFKKIKK